MVDHISSHDNPILQSKAMICAPNELGGNVSSQLILGGQPASPSPGKAIGKRMELAQSALQKRIVTVQVAVDRPRYFLGDLGHSKKKEKEI